MPSGIILSSGSQGATQEAIEEVLNKHGYEADKPETTTPEEIVEPKREDFASDEEFEAAQEKFEAAQEEREEKEEQEEEERERREEEKRPRLTRKQRAIEKATRELREENRKLAERLAALEAGGGGKKTEAVKVEEPKAPKRSDFKEGAEGDAAFEEAQFDYRYQLRRAKEAAEEAAKQTKTQREAHWANYKSNVEKFAEEHDDFNEVVTDKIKIHEAVYEAIVRLENPAITYYLAKHPDYAETLAAMDPFSAVVEVGRLAERLKPATARTTTNENTREKPKTRPETLPEPVKPLRSPATASTLSSREAAQKRDYRAFKAAQRKGV